VKIPPEELKGKEPPTVSFTIDPKARLKSVDFKVREFDNVRWPRCGVVMDARAFDVRPVTLGRRVGR